VCVLTDVKEPVVEEQGSRYSMRTRGQPKGGENKENGLTGTYYSTHIDLLILMVKIC
jgi:hypothetical protein